MTSMSPWGVMMRRCVRWQYVTLLLCVATTAGCSGVTASPDQDAGELDAARVDATSPDAGDVGARTDGGACDHDQDMHLAISCGGDDCDDDDAQRYPGRSEVCDASDHDEDCDPTTFGDVDRDGDGHVDLTCCNGAAAERRCGDDCDDDRNVVYPGNTEACDSFDNDCDAAIDEGVLVTCYADEDADGYAVLGAAPVSACSCGTGTTAVVPTTAADCDDADVSRSPAVPEVCNGVDDDCSGVVDDGLPLVTLFVDADGDGFGGATVRVCGNVPGTAEVGGDCDDAAAAAHPGGTEICDGLDDDCNGATDEVLGAACTSGIGACAVAGRTRCDGTCSAMALAPSTTFQTTPATNGSWDWNCDGAVESNFATPGTVVADQGTYCSTFGTMQTCQSNHGSVLVTGSRPPPYCGAYGGYDRPTFDGICRWFGSCIAGNWQSGGGALVFTVGCR